MKQDLRQDQAQRAGDKMGNHLIKGQTGSENGVEEDMGKQRTSYTVGENVYWCKLFERLFSLRN